jgi:hypothetical protein
MGFIKKTAIAYWAHHSMMEIVLSATTIFCLVFG